MPRDVLAVVLGFGAAVYMGGLYLYADEENREDFCILGFLMAVISAVCVAIGIFDTNALFGAAAGLSGAGAVFVGRLLAPERPAAYGGIVAALGVLFLASLGYGFGSVMDAK